MLEEVLHDVVTIHILHQRQSVGLKLSEDAVFDLWLCPLKGVLYEDGAVMICTALHDVTVDMLDL